jgi:cell division protein FtsB
LSQVANTFWDDRIERVSAATRETAVAKRRVRSRRLIDSVIIAIILAAIATCVSVYTRARGELGGALLKHAAASEKLSDLTVKVQKLERDVQQLRTDSRVIELFARQRFGFVRSGDIVIKVVQDPDTAKASHERAAGITSRIERQTAEQRNAETQVIEKQAAGRQTEGQTAARKRVESNTAVTQNAERRTAPEPSTEQQTAVKRHNEGQTAPEPTTEGQTAARKTAVRKTAARETLAEQ